MSYMLVVSSKNKRVGDLVYDWDEALEYAKNYARTNKVDVDIFTTSGGSRLNLCCTVYSDGTDDCEEDE